MAKSLKINIILPFFGSQAGGGLKVMYEYAKRLYNRGHDVVIYSSIKTNYTTSYSKKKFSLHYKCFVKHLKGRQRPSWFPLPEEIVCYMIPYISDYYIRDADICFSTWWATAYHISELSESKGTKFNLIQAYETIMTLEPEDVVHNSYKLPINHIVISPYLNDIVSLHSLVKPHYLPNAIDLNLYTLVTPIGNRDSNLLIMRYSSSKYKACSYGLEAFLKLKQKYPDLRVILFSSEKRSGDIPQWMEYIYGRSDTAPLYNQASIYVSSSITEGWPLPPMEAMACGCACVCTNIPSHLSYMVDGENALLVHPENVDDLVDKISFLIEYTDQRIALAERANTFIQQYDWELSVDKLEDLFITQTNE